MNFIFNLIFFCFVINLSCVCSSFWNPFTWFGGNNPFDGATYPKSESRRLHPRDLLYLHHAFTFKNMTWKNAEVIYELDIEFDEIERDRIFAGMSEIQNASCIRFVPVNKTRHRHYVKILKDYTRRDHAEADVGCNRDGEQGLWFGSDRIYHHSYHYTILHELLHTIGFDHHYLRSDRDEFIEFHIENTYYDDDYLKLNYRKTVDPDPEVKFHTDFDFESVMMCDAYHGSKGGRPFVTSKVKGKKLPEYHVNYALSKSDKILLNKFHCPEEPKNKTC